MKKHVCAICGYVYDPKAGDPDAGVQPNTDFSKLPSDWSCPDCGAPLSAFEEE